ncbi:MAG: hypothetical protein ABTQ34_02280 [Bdellovibrionales bacterium]
MYDNGGNLESDGKFTYTFGADGKLAKVVGAGVTVENAPQSAVLKLTKFIAFLQKNCIARSQIVETFQKKVFGDVTKKSCERPQFSAAQRLGFSCDIAAHDGFLVKQTKLDGYAGQDAIDQANCAFPAIYGDARKTPALSRQIFQSVLKHGECLVFNLLPMDVAAFGAVDHQPMPATEERAIQRQRHWLGGYLCRSDVRLIAIKFATQRPDAQFCIAA